MLCTFSGIVAPTVSHLKIPYVVIIPKTVFSNFVVHPQLIVRLKTTKDSVKNSDDSDLNQGDSKTHVFKKTQVGSEAEERKDHDQEEAG